MNVAKNWALTIMLIALAFAQFSSKLLLKEQMIIPVKKNNVKQRWSYRRRIDRFQRNLPKKKSSKIGCFLLIVSWRSFPPQFPVKSADFSKNLPLKILRYLTFSAKIPRNRTILRRILTFLPRKSREIGRFFSEFKLFSRENPAKSADFSVNLPLKILQNFAFFREISEAL